MLLNYALFDTLIYRVIKDNNGSSTILIKKSGIYMRLRSKVAFKISIYTRAMDIIFEISYNMLVFMSLDYTSQLRIEPNKSSNEIITLK
jgi:uncharacterized pyridoxamine 5'-phosphate oxidase family protein